jgi:hypothetical protein
LCWRLAEIEVHSGLESLLLGLLLRLILSLVLGSGACVKVVQSGHGVSCLRSGSIRNLS